MFDLSSAMVNYRTEAGTQGDLGFAVGPVLPLCSTPPPLISDPLAAQMSNVTTVLMQLCVLIGLHVGDPHLYSVMAELLYCHLTLDMVKSI